MVKTFGYTWLVVLGGGRGGGRAAGSLGRSPPTRSASEGNGGSNGCSRPPARSTAPMPLAS
eukprot:8139060-Lingulodinium_polyedra.AAC.1